MKIIIPTSDHLWSYAWLGGAAALHLVQGPERIVAWAPPLGALLLLRFWHTQSPGRAFVLSWIAIGGAKYWLHQDFVPIGGTIYAIFIVVSSALGLLPFGLDRIVAARRTGMGWTLLFPAASVALDYLLAAQASGAIMSIANTQRGDTALAQLAAVTGLWGIGFGLLWSASIINWAWNRSWQWPAIRRGALIGGGVLVTIVLLGTLRLALAPTTTPTVRSAAISVDNLPIVATAYHALTGETITIPNDVSQASPEVARLNRGLIALLQQPDDPRFAPAREAMRAVQDQLFALTEREARAGARIVAWAEANALVFAADEPALIARGQRVAQQHGIYLFMTLGTFAPDAANALGGTLANTIVAVGPDGQVLARYYKTRLPPGDPSLRGDGRLPLIDTPYGRIAAVVCYDADTPDLVRQAGRAGAALLIVPSGDWQAISRWHAQAHTLRAIENGVALLRPTTRGLSLATDAYGRTLAAQDWWSTSERVLVASLPLAGTPTLYPLLGDALAHLCIAATLLTIAGGIGMRLRRTGRWTRKPRAGIEGRSVGVR